MKTIHFTFGGMLTIGKDSEPQEDREIGPERYRLHYDETSRGVVTPVYCEQDQTRYDPDQPDKPTTWLRCQMVEEVKNELKRSLESEIKREQQRQVEQYEESRWAHG